MVDDGNKLQQKGREEERRTTIARGNLYSFLPFPSYPFVRHRERLEERRSRT